MTRLLVSVRSLDEAVISVHGGADIVDVKEPTRGSLGAANPDVVAEITEELSGRVPISAACGELLDAEDAEHERLPPKLAFAKLGLAGCQRVPAWPDRLVAAWARMPTSIEKVAVAYADWQGCLAPHPECVIEAAAGNGCKYFLLDTCDKTHALLTSIPHPVIGGWIKVASEAQLTVAIAGSLRVVDLPLVARCWSPAVIAVRGAACSGSRESVICAARVQELRATIDRLGCRP